MPSSGDGEAPTVNPKRDVLPGPRLRAILTAMKPGNRTQPPKEEDRRRRGLSRPDAPAGEGFLDGCVVRVGRYAVIVLVVFVGFCAYRRRPEEITFLCGTFPLPPGSTVIQCDELEPGSDAYNVIATTTLPPAEATRWYREGKAGLPMGDAVIQIGRGVEMLQDEHPYIDVAISIVGGDRGTQVIAAWQNNPREHAGGPKRESQLREALKALRPLGS